MSSKTWSMSYTHYQPRCRPVCFSSQQDWMTKLAVADEVAARIEPRRAMAVLMNVGKPLQTSDNIFMTEWVAIFRESGLRDDITIANLQDACLKLVVLARARARELQVDQQIERAQQPLSAKTAIPTTKPKPKSAPASDKPVCRSFLQPDGCKNGLNCQYAHPRTNGKCLRCGSESRSGHKPGDCETQNHTVGTSHSCAGWAYWQLSPFLHPSGLRKNRQT